MSKVRIFGNIEKVDEQDDGTLIVHGIASTEAVDSQGEIVTRAAMANAIPDYMKFGAVREMHQPMAAGTALKCSVDEGGVTHLEAHIVDPVAVKKVLASVYKGFSIGGKVKGRDEVNKNTITALRLTEISLVDVPANPEAVFAISKLDDDDDEIVTTTGDFLGKWAGEEIGDSMVALQCLSDAFYLLTKEKQEAEASPEQIVALTAVVENLKAFIASEIREENSEKLGKKGARFSKSTKEALGTLHKAVKDATVVLDKLGYMEGEDMKDEDSEKGEFPKGDKEPKKEKDPKDTEEDSDAKASEDAASEDAEEKDPKAKAKAKAKADAEEKEKAEQLDDLKKVNADIVTKADALTAELAKMQDEKAELQKRVEELEKLPAPAKGSVMAVAKSGTPQQDDSKLEPIRKGDGSVDEVATAIKGIHIGAISAHR